LGIGAAAGAFDVTGGGGGAGGKGKLMIFSKSKIEKYKNMQTRISSVLVTPSCVPVIRQKLR